MKDSKPVAMKPHKYPSYLSLSEDELPAIKDWQVGKTYNITVRAKQVSSSLDDVYEEIGTSSKNKKMKARFEIVEVLCEHDKKPAGKRSERIENIKKHSGRY